VFVQKNYDPFTRVLLRAHRAAKLRVSILEDNTEMDSKEMGIMTSRLNLILIIYNLKISIFSHNICSSAQNILPG